MFTDAARLADRYRDGRILLAGDAAHSHFPIGGQGLNLGLQDAVNLGWKLAAEVRSTAPPGLLDTYEAERRPAGQGVVHNTRAQLALMDPSADVAPLRALVSELLDHEEVAQRVAGMLTGVDTGPLRSTLRWRRRTARPA